MGNLKAELRIISQADTGAQSAKEGVIDAFLSMLALYLTPAAIDSLSPTEARKLLVAYLDDISSLGVDAATETFMRHIGPLALPRQLPEIVEASNVVSIFQK